MLRQAIFVAAFILSTCSGVPQLPPAIVICEASDSVCFIREMQSILTVLQNDPSLLYVDNIQPMKIKSWTVPPGHVANFKQVYKNLRLYNHAFNNIVNVQSHSTNSSLFLSIEIYNPEVATKADYKFKNATFMGVSVSSKGKTTLRHQGYRGHVNITSKIVERKGEEYLQITDLVIGFTASRIIVDFKTGNPALDNTINQVFNDNWSVLLEDLGSGYEKLYEFFYLDVMNTIFSKFPYKALFLN